jgi:hypothetical protein
MNKVLDELVREDVAFKNELFNRLDAIDKSLKELLREKHKKDLALAPKVFPTDKTADRENLVNYLKDRSISFPDGFTNEELAVLVQAAKDSALSCDAVRDHLRRFVNIHGTGEAMALLANYNVERISDLDERYYFAFVRDILERGE